MLARLIGLFAGFAVLAAIFAVIERLSPAKPDQPAWRRDSGTDLAYWFFTPLVSKAISRLAVGLAVALLAWHAGVPLTKEAIRAWAATPRAGWIAAQPRALQALEVLVLGDFVGYWMHRLFHGRRLWKFHAVHHMSTQVDWLSSVRLHPGNDVATRLVQVFPFVLLGFDTTVLAAYVPFLSFFAIMLHANVTWDFGPLRYLIASPKFHRWHHTADDEGLDKNFAGLLPIWDLLFGTWYMPEGRQPARFGVRGTPPPDGLWAQLWYPFAGEVPKPVSTGQG